VAQDNLIHNMPVEQQEAARYFFVAFRPGFSDEVLAAVRRHDCYNPYELLALHNARLGDSYSLL
jgi:hypothetical protein